MLSIFQYTNYREFLRDYYAFHKATQKGFSHRIFLQKAGFTGPNYLREVINGKKNLSPAGTGRFAKALGLPEKESRYFGILVNFNQAKTPARKRAFFNQLSSFLTESTAQQLQKGQYDYFSKWYNIAVREQINCIDFRGDYDSLAKLIFPRISAAQAEKAVKLLERLDLIRKNGEGVYELTDPAITTGPELRNLGAFNYHKEMLDVGKKALDRVPQNERYFRTITGSFTEETYQQIKLEIDRARQRILELIDEDRGKKMVFNIGMQLYPLHHKQRRKPRKRKGQTK